MIIDALKAIALAGIPIGFVSYYFTRMTSSKTQLKSNNSKELKLELKTTTLKKEPEDSFFIHLLHKKWMRFGGGFYGVMVFITYVHVEFIQVLDFISKFKGLQHFIDSIGIMMIVKFLIEAVTNLITAFLWFFYWFKYLPIGSFWVWIIVAFIAHASATKLALMHSKK